ncbi:hypothetical protein [Massilibacteroides sp.]|uniref:hypothetical protein n=1 Tax=Massilibacteroides sp. TaxID=2034766 RepID=UPI00260EB6A8|nr:hypothetical protein [Massilibacteroides sp.]MDD4516857.1 hypothetical protein [Massilibacteroides sp.]
MKVLILLVTGPFMAIFLLAGIQTIEWNLDNGTPVPFLAYALLIVVMVWGVFAATAKKSELEKFDKITKRENDEKE